MSPPSSLRHTSSGTAVPASARTRGGIGVVAQRVERGEVREVRLGRVAQRITRIDQIAPMIRNGPYGTKVLSVIRLRTSSTTSTTPASSAP